VNKEMGDLISEEILKLITNSAEPLETKEIEQKIEDKIKKESVTRTKIFYRLNLLRGEGKIKGKFIGSGKGVWVWWFEKMFGGKR
jgi:repressor of nif and glnA expression